MAWTKEENIRNSATGLKRQIELIEEKAELLKQRALKGANGESIPIKNIFRGGVYWAELGENNIGGEKNKTRPFLVISPNKMNKGHTIVGVPLSSKFTTAQNGLPQYANHYLLKKSDYDSLDSDSVVKFEDIRSIDVVRLRELICNINESDMSRMKKNILFMFGY